jgi:hypothetical protein
MVLDATFVKTLPSQLINARLVTPHDATSALLEHVHTHLRANLKTSATLVQRIATYQY